MLFGAAFRIVFRSLKDVWEDAFQLALTNVVWLFLSIVGPILAYLVWTYYPQPVLVWVSTILALLSLPLASSGMMHVTSRTAHGNAVHLSDLFAGIRRSFWISWLWLLANLVVLALVYISLGFYTNLVQGPLEFLVGGFWLAVALVWIMMQIYFWPLIVLQTKINMIRAWRNAFILVVQEPLFAMILALAIFLLTGLCIIFSVAFMVAYMAIIGLIANRTGYLNSSLRSGTPLARAVRM